MEKEDALKVILNGIDFIDRYKNLSLRYQNFEARMISFSLEKAEQIILELGYQSKYVNSENFFKIVEKLDKYEFQYNIYLKGGMVESIWDLKKNNERLSFTGPWGRICRLINDNEERIKLPVFCSYKDLKEILIEVFAIYEDYKKSLLA